MQNLLTFLLIYEGKSPGCSPNRVNSIFENLNRVCLLLFKEFMKKLEEKRAALNKATSMGEAILTTCHPDSITTVKHWNTIIKARFEEVSAASAGRRLNAL